jgi:DNA polymerase-1
VDKSGETRILHKRIPGAKRAFTHKALNARIQGSAADVMKKAMVDIYESGVCDVLGVPQLTVHDELCGSLPRTKEGKEAYEEMKRLMEGTVKLSVPLTVDGKIGANWKECK